MQKLSSARHKKLKTGLELIFEGIAYLRANFKGRAFTIDGRLVGDIGEIIAQLEYGLALDEKGKSVHDGTCPAGRRVSVKATFQDKLTFKGVPDYMLGFKLYSNGEFELIYNGPGKLIADHYKGRRAGIGEKQHSFPISILRELSAEVPEDQRIVRHQKRSTT
jgi:hypothetical protein